MLSGKEALILGNLMKREMYGLELVNESGGSLKRGTVYVTLRRMQEKGFVTSHRETDGSEGGSERRRYAITALGRRIHAAWEQYRRAYRGLAPLPIGS